MAAFVGFGFGILGIGYGYGYGYGHGANDSVTLGLVFHEKNTDKCVCNFVHVGLVTCTVLKNYTFLCFEKPEQL